MIHNTHNSGISPIIGVMTLLIVIIGLVSILSFNLFSGDYAVVDESFDIDYDIEQNDEGIIVDIWQNENIKEFVVKHNGEDTNIDLNSTNSQEFNFGTGRYTLIATNNNNNQRAIESVYIGTRFDVVSSKTTVSTNEDIIFGLVTNFDTEDIDSYDWIFDDGSSSTDINPIKSYDESGNYTVEINVSKNGNEYSDTKSIYVDSSLSTPTYPDNTSKVIDNMDGNGTVDNPYIITTDYELQAINEDLSAYYEIKRNINLTETVNWRGGSGFKPIGIESPFTGKINGNNYTINDLYIDKKNTSEIGLFSQTENSEIKNINVTNTNISGQSDVGGVVGVNNNTNVTNTHIVGNIRSFGELRAGGLIGYNKNSIISKSSSNVNVSGTGNNVGGFIGKNDNSFVTESYSSSVVIGENNIGGFVGTNINNSDINMSYSQSELDSNGESVYSGGLIALNENSSVSNTYSATVINTDNQNGGVIGENRGQIDKSYWDENLFSDYDEFINGSTGLSTEEMKGPEPYNNEFKTDIVDKNEFKHENESYPKLDWEVNE